MKKRRGVPSSCFSARGLELDVEMMEDEARSAMGRKQKEV